MGIHAWCAPLEWCVNDPAVCSACTNKPCISKDNINNFFARSCTSNLYPPGISNNHDCLLCTQCSKSCDKNNLSFRFRNFFADIFKSEKIPVSVVIFSILLSGFLIYELSVLWRPARNIILFPPDWIIFNYEIESHWGIAMIRGGIVMILYPALLWLIPALINKLIKFKTSLSDYLRTTAVAYFPLLALVHLIVGLQDTAPRIKYIPLVLKDPEGVHTASLLVSRALKLPGTIPPFWDSTIGIIQLILISLGIVISIIAAYKIAKNNSKITFIAPASGIILYSGIFLAIILFWKFL